MYLHTRLLLGIAAVTLAALLLSVLIALGSVRPDADRETAGALQLTRLLLNLEDRVRAASRSPCGTSGSPCRMRQGTRSRRRRSMPARAAGLPPNLPGAAAARS
jgi:hypothetical protein